MKNKIDLVTGETYTLSELFSGVRKIIIPDLQRDYCWGYCGTDKETNGTDLVSCFVNRLVKHLENPNFGRLNIGIIYGYELPAHHVQLCDGQQRITTLYLLIGMLNRRMGDNRYSRFLAPSEVCEQSLREPYLQYAIRESSLYFLRDLLNTVFLTAKPLDETGIAKVVKNSDWYFGDYDLDPSVQSMIGALASIEAVLGKMSKAEMDLLGRFLLEGLTFMYYDLENRRNGEETFVVINTAGEPLSPTENLKPVAIGAAINKDYKGNDDSSTIADDWEKIETWFWRKRENGNDTTDVGFHEFLRWVAILYYAGSFSADGVNVEEAQKMLSADVKGWVFPIEKIPFANIKKTWEIVAFLFDEWEFRNELVKEWLYPKDRCIAQVDCFRLLPLVAWLLKHDSPTRKEKSRNLLRIHRFFGNISRLEDVRKNVNEIFCDAIRLAAKYEDIVKAEAETHISNTLLTDEERLKIRILIGGDDRREEIEEAFWTTQNFEIFSGEISPLLNWAHNSNGEFCLRAFNCYAEKFHEVFQPKDKSTLDLARRALLSYDLKGYPVRNGKNLSFCGENWQWKKVVFENSKLIRKFLDELSEGVEIQSIIDRCDPANKWFEFAHSGCLLEWCENKNVQTDSAEGIILIKKTYATTIFPVSLLAETRERFGAEGISYLDERRIGFYKAFGGHEAIFQRWLNPGPNEVDLYLMSDKNNRDSYIEGSNPNGENDWERYTCAKIPDTMPAEEITEVMKSLIEMSDTRREERRQGRCH